MRINKLLLDTHVFLWWRANDPLLQEPAKAAIADADVVFVSAASAWEAGIKASLGRLDRKNIQAEQGDSKNERSYIEQG